ncbi:MAG TPA: protein kinase [Thermoanaerobaculia bacterium]
MTQLDETVGLGPEPGRIGPYRLARRLGRGGMGEVFLAWDERLGRRVALKRIRGDSSVAQDGERLRREARAAAQLSHPSVVQIYDLVTDASGDVIVLEYVEGRTLREVLEDGLPSLSMVLRLSREIAEGLAAAHAAGLVHRDLKTENVMVTPEGRAKILDFGLAKPFLLSQPHDGENLTAQGVLLGTFHAMSPEQARGSEVDARSDLFSFGVLLYEMLTGRSPFQGSDSLDTLQKVCSHHPPSVRTLRPELPGSLSNLVDSLLAKRREERPRNAGEVALELGVLAGESGPGGLPTSAEPVPVLRKTPGRAAESSALAHVRRPSVLLLLAVLPILAVIAIWLVRRAPAEPLRPLRIMVLAPQVPAGAEEELGLPAAGLLTAELATLSSLEGLAPLEPTQAGPGAASLVAAARTAAADEVMALSLERKGPQSAWASLRRIEGRTGRVLWAGGFALPASGASRGDRDLQLLADTVAVQLRHAYPDRRLRPGIPELDVSDQDYAEFLRVKERIDRGSADLEPELKKLEEIVRSSPRFLEGHLLIASVAQSLFESTRDTTHLERARQAAKAAHELAAGDPRPLEAGFRIALAGKRPAEAEEALAALAAIVPSDPQLEVFAGLLAESRGDLARAVEDVSRAVQRAPSWHNLFLLADLELRAGKTADARRHLEELLARNPCNPWGLDRLGRLELLQGDPERAIATYRELIRVQPLRPYFTNLGLAHSLLGRHAEAAAAYRQALALDPNHARVLLNLADAELAQEHGSAAAELYRRALSRFDEIQAAGALTAKDSMDKAQCLAHLGRIPEAVELTQKTLRESGDDAELFYAASLVYALAGDRASFLLNAKLALDNGMQPRWFTLPVFGALRNDPDLGALLRRSPA